MRGCTAENPGAHARAGEEYRCAGRERAKSFGEMRAEVRRRPHDLIRHVPSAHVVLDAEVDVRSTHQHPLRHREIPDECVRIAADVRSGRGDGAPQRREHTQDDDEKQHACVVLRGLGACACEPNANECQIFLYHLSHPQRNAVNLREPSWYHRARSRMGSCRAIRDAVILSEAKDLALGR